MRHLTVSPEGSGEPKFPPVSGCNTLIKCVKFPLWFDPKHKKINTCYLSEAFLCG